MAASSNDGDDVVPPKQYIPKIIHRRIPLDDKHKCPICDGKGYINIVDNDTKRPLR